MKSSLFKFIFVSTFAAMFAVACTNDVVNPGREDGVAVRISADMGGMQNPAIPKAATRAANTTWEPGDVIGVTMVKPVSFDVISPYRNFGYKKTSGDDITFSPNDASQIIYFPTSDEQVTFRAYYPYNKELASNLVIPVSTKDQSNLAGIDLMTADHLAGTSTQDPNVKFHFYHRLAKVVVNLTVDNNSISILNGVQLTMGAQKTEASYDLVSEELIVNNSAPDAIINIPVSGAKGDAIVLPRDAGEGMEFKITTAEGRIYTAVMDQDLELKAGYIHTFHIRLKSDVEITATIEPWIEGPERSYDAVHLVTGLGVTEGFDMGHELDLFLKEGAAPDFSLLRKFTLDGENNWIPASPVYWESIVGSPAVFRGATVYEEALNSTQMADILISKDIEVAPFKGINLELEHAGSRLNIILQSSDGTYTDADLEGATVVLPGYLNAGSYNNKGEFVPGTARGDISPENGVAIFPPQSVANGDNLLTVEIDGRLYEVKVEEVGGFDYEKGYDYTFVVDARKAQVELSTLVSPWIEETREYEVRIGSANLDNNEGDLLDEDQLYLFSGDNTNRATLPGRFVYNETTDTWTYEGPSAPLYWEDITDTGNLYASITRPAFNAASGNNQSADYITATPIENKGGTHNTALNFKMTHQVAKVNVMLRSTTYEESKLLNANVTLPGYAIGGGLDKGIYVPGTGVGPILLGKPVKTGAVPEITYNTSSYLQPQTIGLSQDLVTVEMDGRTYTVKPEDLTAAPSDPVVYEAGKVANLIITIEKTGLSASVEVTGWTELPALEYEALFFSVTNKASAGFEHNDQVKFYKLNAGGIAVEDISNVYQYTGGSASGTLSPVGTPWYRDDFQTGDLISAIYPANATALVAGERTFNWTAKSSGITNAHEDDLMIAAPVAARNLGEIQANGDVEFEFKHVLSKVTINLIVGEGFASTEIMPATVAMNNFQLSGTVDAINGIATPTGTATTTFNPTKLGTPNSVTGKTVVSSYEAFVMPQTIVGNTVMVTVRLGDGIFQAKLPADRVFAAGVHNTLNLTLNKTGAELSASIVDWNHEGPIDIELH